MHFVSFLIKSGAAFATVYHVATKSNVSLRTFTQALDSYGQEKQKEDARHIFVINGDDIPVTQVSWEDIFLPPGFLEDIRCNVTMFFEGGNRYRELGIPYRRGLLFTGPPGCGKTLTLKALAYHTAAKFITVLGKSGVDDSDIQRALDAAGKCSPAVVLFEDLDKLIEAKDVSLSHFLNLLDGLKVLSGVLVIATCNEPEKLDPALLHRPSRFDRIWKFPLPGVEERLALLRKRGCTYFSEPVLQDVAERSHGFSMTYVQEVVVNALLECAHDGKNPSDEDLLRSFDTIRSQRRSASKGVASLEAQDNVGFALPNHAGFCSGLSKLT
jgi:SpoVK/Ycf46/Vps4 family AAA+-type ATPase